MCIGKMTAIGRLVVILWVATVPVSMAADDPDSAVPSAGTVDSGSQVQGKGGGMGKTYQKNIAGPGRGYPESRGAASATGPASTAPDAVATPVPGDATEQTAKQAPEPALEQQQPLSRKARDGSGYGSGYPGERGLGVEGSPHHRQYGSREPDPAAAAPVDSKP
jgi:hypothetical protein